MRSSLPAAKSALLPLLAAIILSVLSVSAQAASYEMELPLARAWDENTSTGRRLAEALAAPSEDRQLRPTVTWWWLLEEDEEISSARLAGKREERSAVLSRTACLDPLVSNEGLGLESFTAENVWKDSYEVSISPVRLYHGRRLQALTLTPLRAESGALFALREATLQLETSSGDDTGGIFKPERSDFPLRSRILSGLGASLLNVNALPQTDRAVGGAGFPTSVPSIDGAAIEMVMVTVDSFADLCQSYADTKTNRGLPTVVRTMEWIAERYPHGSDDAELLRNFVRDAYSKWSIRFLMLVGDVELVPVRYIYSTQFVEPEFNPSDLYYACLDGDWNADNDGNWCEVFDDAADLMPEVSVGRLPAADRAECSLMLEKSSSHADAIVPDYQNKVLLLGEVLFPVDYPADPNIIIDGAEYCESVYVNATGPLQSVRRMYENFTAYPGAEYLTASGAMYAMRDGQTVVLHNGHGARGTMSLGEGSIGAMHVRQMDNTDQYFMLYMVNCTAAAFDFNCLAEEFLRCEEGGAMSVIGSVNITFPVVNSLYQDMLFEELYANPVPTLGELFNLPIIAFEPGTDTNSGYRWAHSTLALLSDPSLRLRYVLPDSLSLTCQDTLQAGEMLPMTVLDSGGNPWPDARVCLRRGDEDYLWAESDSLGQVSFLPAPETAGWYQIRVDARDALPYSDSLLVLLPLSEAYLAAGDVLIDDVDDGVVFGDGDGVCERGETVRLFVPASNTGAAAVDAVIGQLAVSSPYATIIDSVCDYGTVAAGAESAGDGFLVQILDPADDAILPFSIQFDSDTLAFGDGFFLEAAASLLSMERSVLDDGDDGVIDVGETATLQTWLANWGRGSVSELSATVSVPDSSGLSVLAGEMDWGDLEGLSKMDSPLAFSIARIDTLPPLLTLALADRFGWADTLDLILEAPADTVGAPVYELKQDATRVRVSWEPTASAAAYVLLRSDTPEGPYEEISEDWLDNSAFDDTGLSPYTSYWYRAAPLSASGLVGAWSDSSKVTTNPSLLPGWPQTMELEASGSPVVTDVDGDGDLEIFVGSDALYAFYPDGTELADGDDNPGTFGPATEGDHKFFASLASGSIYAAASRQVIGACWETGNVYVWTFMNTPDGLEASVAPGWPQHVDHDYGIWASPSIGNVDQDSYQEIFAVDISGHMMAWNHDGSELIDGDGNASSHGVFADDIGWWTRSTATFANLDEDDQDEIMVGTVNGYLKAYNGDGSYVPGFPFHAGEAIFSSAVTADLDGDGTVEIIFAAEDDSLYVLDHDGTRHGDWPIFLENNNWALCPSVALADIAGDSLPEIFACSIDEYEFMHVGWYDRLGAPLAGWPVLASFSTQSSPVVGDLDGDGDLETVLVNEFGIVEAWHHDASSVDGFPIMVEDFARATPVLRDINGDGMLDMLFAGWDKSVYLWTFPTEYDAEAVPWHTFLHDQRRSGNAAGELDWELAVGVAGAPPSAVRLSPNWPNPFNPRTQIKFNLAGGKAEKVRLSIHDVRGRCIAMLEDGVLVPGSYTRIWSGLDENGHSVASGVYFARLSVGAVVETRKMTLLK